MAETNVLEKLRDIGVLSEEARNKLNDILHRLENLDDDKKKDFMEDVKGLFKKSMRDFGRASSFPLMINSNVIFFFAIFIVFFIMVFFVYKLFRCLKEREQKKEEKKKNKQLKKKK